MKDKNISLIELENKGSDEVNAVHINKNENSSNEFRIIPLKLEIDLKTPQLKTKGVKLKTKVKKNTQEDLSQ